LPRTAIRCLLARYNLPHMNLEEKLAELKKPHIRSAS
jgi:hypothetical protein